MDPIDPEGETALSAHAWQRFDWRWRPLNATSEGDYLRMYEWLMVQRARDVTVEARHEFVFLVATLSRDERRSALVESRVNDFAAYARAACRFIQRRLDRTQRRKCDPSDAIRRHFSDHQETLQDRLRCRDEVEDLRLDLDPAEAEFLYAVSTGSELRDAAQLALGPSATKGQGFSMKRQIIRKLKHFEAGL